MAPKGLVVNGRAVDKAVGKAAPAVELEVGGRTVRLSNPDRVYFPATGATKRDLADYYLAVADGIVRALRERPCMMPVSYTHLDVYKRQEQDFVDSGECPTS